MFVGMTGVMVLCMWKGKRLGRFPADGPRQGRVSAEAKSKPRSKARIRGEIKNSLRTFKSSTAWARYMRIRPKNFKYNGTRPFAERERDSRDYDLLWGWHPPGRVRNPAPQTGRGSSGSSVCLV